MFNRNTFSDKKLFLKLGIANILLFWIVYVPTNQFSHETYYRLYFSWELSIPFLKWMIIPYHCFNLIFLIPFLLLPSKQIKILSTSSAICTVLAGIVFILFPAQIGFHRVIPDGLTASLYKFLFTIDNTTNLVPSLHVTYVVLYFLSSVGYLKRVLTKITFGLVSILIISSTLFTHQHHIIDILSGILLASTIFWIVQKHIHKDNDKI